MKSLKKLHGKIEYCYNFVKNCIKKLSNRDCSFVQTSCVADL